MKLNHCYHGDCRDVMRQLLDQGGGGKVQTIVTSPPYWNLRDYGVAGQIGMEPTLQEFVATMVEVFALCRELLADDGTLWLNLGDSYANDGKWGGSSGGKHVAALHGNTGIGRSKVKTGLKPKDLCGVPWRVALALQEPRYQGKVKDERDRVWLAAMVDAEGSICGTEYQTGDRTKTNLYISITNTSAPIIDKCERLFPQVVKHVYEKSGPSSRMCYRWDVERMETKALFLREIYPYLVAKRKQVVIGYTFLEMQRGLASKKNGYLAEQHEQRSWLMAALSKLNGGGDVDLPDWVIEPPTLYEPGFYLRQDIIWSKPNPMPESVRDRCTKAHEYLFLLTKSPRYYFDQDAILEPCSPGTHARLAQDVQNQIGSERANGGAKTNGNMKAVARKPGNVNPPKGQLAYEAGDERHRTKAGLLGYAERQRKVYSGTGVGFGRGTDAEQRGRGRVKNNESFDAAMAIMPDKRNRRSVWTIPTQSYSEAHFATFPEALVEPCILAGSRPGDIVFDPFMGSGTVAQVAQNLGRKWIGSELNPEYIALQAGRTRQQGLEFAA